MILAQLSKHRCMGNVMKFLSPYLKGFLPYIMSWISCPIFFVGRYTPEVCVQTNFPFHCFVYLSGDLYDLSIKILLLMLTPRCTIILARPCYYWWWHSGSHRWTRTFPVGPPCSTSRKMVLFVPRPWYRCCYRHNWQAALWHALLSWPCKMSSLLLLLIHMVGP